MDNTLIFVHDYMAHQAYLYGENAHLVAADDPYQMARVQDQNCTFDISSSGLSPHTGVTYHLTYQVVLNAVHGLFNFLTPDRLGSIAAMVFDPSLGEEKVGTLGLRPWED